MEKKYQEMYKTAEKQGMLEELEISFWKPEKEGDFILGRVESVDFIKGPNDGVYGRYTIDTDEGVKNVNFGASIDLLFKNNAPEGRIFKFVYQGMGKNNKGKPFHKYHVTEAV
jgi:hypothetical protein